MGKRPSASWSGPADVVELRRAHGHEHRPLSGRGPLDPEAHPLDDVPDRMASGEGESAAGLQPLAVHVRVRIVEARAHRRAFEVDDPRRMPAPGKHLGGRAEGGDGARGDPDRLRRPGGVVEGQDVAVVEDEIVLAHGCRLPSTGSRAVTIPEGRSARRTITRVECPRPARTSPALPARSRRSPGRGRRTPSPGIPGLSGQSSRVCPVAVFTAPAADRGRGCSSAAGR